MTADNPFELVSIFEEDLSFPYRIDILLDLDNTTLVIDLRDWINKHVGRSQVDWYLQPYWVASKRAHAVVLRFKSQEHASQVALHWL